jgi:starch synthase
VFEPYESRALLQAIRRALAAYKTPRTWRRLQQHGMRADFSWGRSARQYLALYARAARRVGRAVPAGG